MKPILFILSLFLTMQMTPVDLFPLNDVKKEFKEQGWDIPCVKESHRIVSSRESRSEVIEGISVKISSIPTNEQKPNIFGQNSKFAVVMINQYSFNEKPFCYFAVIGNGDRAGLTMYAYYDEEGEGVFQLREDWGTPTGRSDISDWRIHLPDWVKEASQKQ
jgi:hypothetical protein